MNNKYVNRINNKRANRTNDECNMQTCTVAKIEKSGSFYIT